MAVIRDRSVARGRPCPNRQFIPVKPCHWFTSDGMVHAITLGDGRASCRTPTGCWRCNRRIGRRGSTRTTSRRSATTTSAAPCPDGSPPIPNVIRRPDGSCSSATRPAVRSVPGWAGDDRTRRRRLPARDVRRAAPQHGARLPAAADQDRRRSTSPAYGPSSGVDAELGSGSGAADGTGRLVCAEA